MEERFPEGEKKRESGTVPKSFPSCRISSRTAAPSGQAVSGELRALVAEPSLPYLGSGEFRGERIPLALVRVAPPSKLPEYFKSQEQKNDMLQTAPIPSPVCALGSSHRPGYGPFPAGWSATKDQRKGGGERGGLFCLFLKQWVRDPHRTKKEKRLADTFRHILQDVERGSAHRLAKPPWTAPVNFLTVKQP